MSSTDDCTTTYGIILIGNPHYENNVECRGRVIEEFRHNRFHSLTQSNKHKHMYNYSHVKFRKKICLDHSVLYFVIIMVNIFRVLRIAVHYTANFKSITKKVTKKVSL